MKKHIITLIAAILCILSVFLSIQTFRYLLYSIGIVIVFINYKVNYRQQYKQDKETIYDIIHCIFLEFDFEEFKTNNPDVSKSRLRLYWRLYQLFVGSIIVLLISSLILTVLSVK